MGGQRGAGNSKSKAKGWWFPRRVILAIVVALSGVAAASGLMGLVSLTTEWVPVPDGVQIHDGREDLTVWVPLLSDTMCRGSEGTEVPTRQSMTTDNVEYVAVLNLDAEGQEYECLGSEAFTTHGGMVADMTKTIVGIIGGIFAFLGALLPRDVFRNLKRGFEAPPEPPGGGGKYAM